MTLKYLSHHEGLFGVSRNERLMSYDYCQRDRILTVKDFAGCGWKAALAGATGEDYCSMSGTFSRSAKQAISEDLQAHGNVLSLLADVCSMVLKPDSVNEPFKPVAMFQDKRSIIPDDLSDGDVIFFARIVNEIDDPSPMGHLLKARLADLVWLLQRPRDIKYGLAAIDSYRSIPLDKETWACGGDKCWQRAIGLARMLKLGAGGRLEEIEASMLEALSLATRQDGFLCLRVADLLLSNALGRDHSTKIATKLESLARVFEGDGEFLKAREYFQASAKWFMVAGDDEKSFAMTVEVAEGWVKETDARLTSDKPRHTIAVTHFEKAIQTYRSIPRAVRATHQVDDRIAELRQQLSESGKRSVDEMGVFRTPVSNITKIVVDSRNSVSGKTLNEALVAFVNLAVSESVRDLRESTIEQIGSYPLQFLFSGISMSRDGRVVAKRPGISVSNTPSDNDETDNNEKTIYAKMIENYGIHVDLAVRGCILPAHEVLLVEHRLREPDLFNLAS